MSETKPLISVIVPIYNVEKYVRKCLDSLKNQTMKQIEVICIDDGSTDRSGEIAEEYKSQNWPQFRVIHTENHGLSAARNRGLDEALADWIMFVDSDDWVEEKFCEKPYYSAIEKNADLVVFCLYEILNGKKKPQQFPIPFGITDEYTVYEYGLDYTWNKLYSRELFTEIRYPEGRVFEDVATTHKLVHASKLILCIEDCLYYYCIRKESISHTLSSESKKDRYYSYLEKYHDLVLYNYPERELRKIRLILLTTAIGYLSVTWPCSERYYQYAKDIANSVERIPSLLSYRHRIALALWKYNRKLFFVFYIISGRLKE